VRPNENGKLPVTSAARRTAEKVSRPGISTGLINRDSQKVRVVVRRAKQPFKRPWPGRSATPPALPWEQLSARASRPSSGRAGRRIPGGLESERDGLQREGRPVLREVSRRPPPAMPANWSKTLAGPKSEREGRRCPPSADPHRATHLAASSVTAGGLSIGDISVVEKFAHRFNGPAASFRSSS
jgi:hypothetical protein